MNHHDEEDNEILISIPYNENNILIDEEGVERLLRNFGIDIKVNNSEYFSLFLFFDLLLLLTGIFFMIIGYKIPI